MKKLIFVAILGMSALMAHAQQWAGSTTTSDTIYRYGVTQIRPTTTGNPYVQIENSSIKLIKAYGNTYAENTLILTPYELYLDYLAPTDRSSTSITRGSFNFRNCNGMGCNAKTFILSSDGTLSTNGKINCTDSLLAYNIKATNAVKALSADIPTISGSTGTFSTKVTAPSIAVNNTSVPTNFNFAVTGKSYFSDFVGIGTTNLTATSGYKLAVDGGILCEEVKVISNVPSSDYVFEKDYNLRSLGEVEAYVNENKHLPDVPSAKEFKENGYKMGDMDNLLLQKIEELTLYIIEQQKQIDELKSKLNE